MDKTRDETINKLVAGQQKLEGLFYDLIQTVGRIEKVVINIESDLRSRVDVLLDSDKVRRHETADLKELCQKHEARLEDHEMRILRLEKDMKIT